MKKAIIAGGAVAVVLVVLGVAVRLPAADPGADPSAAAAAEVAPPLAVAPAGLLYGRVTTDDGEVHEGRLRFGGDEEALWGNYFNGFKDGNPWAAHAPRELLPKERLAWKIFGVEIAVEPRADLGRPFMARFGDIARIEARGRELRVTLKSGTVADLDRYAADDFADGVRIWDASGGVLELGEGRVRSIEFLPAAGTAAGPAPLYGTVRTRHGEFTGFIQWDREACLGSDEIHGRDADGEVTLRFDAIRSISRRTGEGALVTLLDGRQIVLTETRRVGGGNRGVYVDDPRYGRVLVSWDAFERLDFSAGDAAPAYADFRPGRPLTGTVVTASGQRFAGRMVYDLDESETTQTLDAPAQGVDYTVPFSLISTIEPNAERGAVDARVTLHDGTQLRLERAGDLAGSNAGMLIFPRGSQSADYVPWAEVERIDVDRAP